MNFPLRAGRVSGRATPSLRHAPRAKLQRTNPGSSPLSLRGILFKRSGPALGAIVEIPALIDAIRNGDIAGAGIDVLPIEPPKRDDIVATAYHNRSDPIVGVRPALPFQRATSKFNPVGPVSAD
jgi:hypothetical protein